MYLKRNIEETIKQAASSFPIIVIYGARQIGKSTLVNHVFGENFNQVTLDDNDELELASNNPKLFLEAHPWPLIIDEVQKAPKLLNEIKKIVDNQRLKWLTGDEKRRLMYILTGSNQFELQQGISESLAGRAAIIDMSSLTMMESRQIEGGLFNPDIKHLISQENLIKPNHLTKKEIFEIIFNGSMPDVVTKNSERNLYYKSYIDTYIEKDVRKLISATKELQFRQFITYLSLRTAQQINYNDISNAISIDKATCKRWLSILETSGIIILLEPYMSNISSRIIKAPKLYFLDTGLAAFLSKWPNADILEMGPSGGAFFETFVISEIVKSFYNHNVNPKNYLFYYRDIDQKEIDIIYAENNRITPIEIKKGVKPTKPNKNFNVLSKYNQEITIGLIIDFCDSIRPINEEVYTFPVSSLGI